MDRHMARIREREAKKQRTISSKDIKKVLPACKNTSHPQPHASSTRQSIKSKESLADPDVTLDDGMLPTCDSARNLAALLQRASQHTTDELQPYASYPDSFPLPRVDKGGLVRRAREKLAEKGEVDQDVRGYLNDEMQRSKERKQQAVSDRQQAEQQLQARRVAELQALRAEQQRERELWSQRVQQITATEEERRKRVLAERLAQREEYQRAVEEKERQRRASSSTQKQKEQRVRLLGTKNIVKDLLEEDSFLRARKAGEMALRRAELARREEGARVRQAQQAREDLVERKVQEFGLRQQWEEAKCRRARLAEEAEQLKQEAERRRLSPTATSAVTPSIAHDYPETIGSHQQQQQLEDDDWWFSNKEIQKVRRGKFCPPTAHEKPEAFSMY